MSAIQQPPPQEMNRMGQQQQQNVVVVQQPTATRQAPLLVGIEGTRDWTTGLCDFTADGQSCLYVWCCYCCAYGSLSERMGENYFTMCVVPGVEIILRTKLRTMGGIRGNIVKDCATVYFCGPCATCQELRELSYMGL